MRTPYHTPRRVVLAVTVLTIGLLAAGVPDATAAPSVRERLAAAQRTLDTLNERISAAVEDYDAARLALADARARAAAASRRADATRVELAARRRQLTALAVSAYQSGGLQPLAVVVSGHPADYLDRIAVLDAVAHRQANVVTAVTAAQARLDAAERSARDAAARADATVRRVAGTRAAIERTVAAQQRIVDRLKAEQARLERIAAERAAAARDAAQRAAAREAAADAAAARQITGGSPKASPPPLPPPASGRAAIAVRAAYTRLGMPYVWGAGGPTAFDCSGLTSWAWAQAGVYLPHSSAAQFNSGPRVAQSALQPGDLVFFYSPIHHVGIYVGGGNMIDAPHTGTVVAVRPVFWANYVGAVRPG